MEQLEKVIDSMPFTYNKYGGKENIKKLSYMVKDEVDNKYKNNPNISIEESIIQYMKLMYQEIDTAFSMTVNKRKIIYYLKDNKELYLVNKDRIYTGGIELEKAGFRKANEEENRDCLINLLYNIIKKQ